MTMAEFRKSAVDVLRRAKRGEQTIVFDANRKVQMVIGVSKHCPLLMASIVPEELDDLPSRPVARSRWLD